MHKESTKDTVSITTVRTWMIARFKTGYQTNRNSVVNLQLDFEKGGKMEIKRKGRENITTSEVSLHGWMQQNFSEYYRHNNY